MSTTKQPLKQEILEALKWAGRKESRASLLFRHTVAESAGLNVTDAECIDFLLEVGSATAGELAKATRLTTGAMTAAIDRLEKAGFVVRERDAQDRRKVVVRPNMAEISKFVPLYESMVSEVEKVYSRYTNKELQFLLQHSNYMADIYENEITRMQQRKTL